MRKIFLVMTIAVILVSGKAAPGWCSGDIILNARPGLAGIYKVNEPVMVNLYVEGSRDRVKGQIIIVPRGEEARDFLELKQGVVYGCEIDVPAGQRATYSLAVPGTMISNSSLVRLVDGDKKLAETSLDGTAVGGGIVIIPLGESMLGSSLFAWLDKIHGGQAMVKFLPPGELPGKPLFLRSADVIVADEEAASSLNESQVNALKEWVRLGGKLILSGPSIFESKGPFKDVVSAKAQTSSVYRESLGRGEIIFTRTAVEEINDPSGKVWGQMGFISRGEDFFGGKKEEMMQVEKQVMAENGSFLPLPGAVGMPVLITLWVIYVLLAGPGMYIILKRINRRDLAWILIPAVAVMTALGLFTLSPVNRLKAYLHNSMSTVDIVDKDLAVLKSSGTFVVPRGGRLEVRGTEDMLLEPLYYFSPQNRSPVLVFGGKEPKVVFEGVEYGSMRQVYSYGTLAGTGMIEGSIFFRDDRVLGSIANKTAFDLRDCRVLIGRNLIEIGNIPSGGLREVNEPLSRSLIVNNARDIYTVDSNTPAQSRESMFVSDYATRSSGSGEVIFLGWSDTPVGNLKVVTPAGEGQAGGVTLVKQNIDLVYPEGDFNLPSGFIKHTMTGMGGAYGEGPQGVMLHMGSLKITYDLKGTLKTNRFSVKSIEVPLTAETTNYSIDLFNNKTSGWDRISGSPVSGQDIAKYVSGEGKIEIRLSSLSDKPEKENWFRGIAVRGVIVK